MPFNQIIDLNAAGNVGRNSYEILLMSTNVLEKGNGKQDVS